jgi:hypothetical protein
VAAFAIRFPNLPKLQTHLRPQHNTALYPLPRLTSWDLASLYEICDLCLFAASLSLTLVTITICCPEWLDIKYKWMPSHIYQNMVNLIVVFRRCPSIITDQVMGVFISVYATSLLVNFTTFTLTLSPSEPALYELLIFHVPYLKFTFHRLGCLSKESIRVKSSCKLFATWLFFTVRGF